MNGVPSISIQPQSMSFRGLCSPLPKVGDDLLTLSRKHLKDVVNAAKYRQQSSVKNIDQAVALINKGMYFINQAKQMLAK